MNKETYESWTRAVSFILQVVGVAGIIFIPAFWAFTDRIEIALLPFFGTIAGVGKGLAVLESIAQGRSNPTEVGDGTTPAP